MTKRQIQDELTQRHIAFAEYIISLDKRDFLFCVDNKWNAGQQLSHIVKSTGPVLAGLRLPNLLLKLLFGTSPSSSRDYKSLTENYKTVLANGGKSGKMFLPASIEHAEAERLKNQLLLTISKINLQLENISEEALDQYRLPHPLLGKLSLREMLYFTMYHVEHHMEKTRENLRYITWPDTNYRRL
jgi:hypothetical protein